MIGSKKIVIFPSHITYFFIINDGALRARHHDFRHIKLTYGLA